MPVALLIHAHPDDEVFATGAACITLAAAGWRVVLRVATGGEAGEGVDLPEHVARERRVHRLERACDLLGIGAWDWLGDQGRWVDDGAAGGSRSPAAADVTDLAAGVVDALGAIRPDLVLSVGGDGLTGHPDHIAIAAAIPLALRSAPDLHCRALGARLRASDVHAAHARLQELLPGAAIGSGRVRGCPAGTPLQAMAGSSTVAQRRRQALDQYGPGLGTADLDHLVAHHPGRGDSLLLRAVLDLAGWGTDRFERLG